VASSRLALVARPADEVFATDYGDRQWSVAHVEGTGMDPATLIVAALAAGALKGAGETASAAVKDTYEALRAAVVARFADKQVPVAVLAEHEDDPETYEKPLAKRIQQADAGRDPRIVALAQELMRLMDADGARSGKYTMDVRGAQGVQVGNGNTQTNTFTTPPIA
jgi:hypothetical protein